MYDSEEDDRRRRGRDDRKNYGRDHNGSNKRPAPRGDEYPSKRGRHDDASDSYDAKFGSDEAPQQPLLTFKKFLLTQTEELSDEDAIQKYNEYKQEYIKTSVEKFFQSHKDEEWFRVKYNPEDQRKTEETRKAEIEKRLRIFNEFKSSGKFDDITLDAENADRLTKILDAIVVKLEDGSDEEVEAVLNGTADITNGKKSHKYQSVYLKNIPAAATFDDIEALSKRSPGFVRLAISEADAHRRFYRQGWVTFTSEVNIKEICWTFNSVRIRDTDLQAVVNREIAKRIRHSNAVTSHKEVAEKNLQSALKLIDAYDKRSGLFTNISEENEGGVKQEVTEPQRTNPILDEVRALGGDAIHEESQDEVYLLGNRVSDETVRFERDENILKALDLAIWYLRVVHSVDFYHQGEYLLEDSMPHRLALLHIRGPSPKLEPNNTNDNGELILASQFVTDFSQRFKQKVETLVEGKFISEEEQVKLGKKDCEEAVEEFIKKNTVELASDKWLCPLSGKKFKGADFIRKHLQSKHEHKLKEAREEALFFNNYVADARRPAEPDPRFNPSAPKDPSRDDDVTKYGAYGGGPSGDHSDRRGNNANRHRESGTGRKYFEEPRRNDNNHRPQVSYRDLDAPDDIV